MPDRFAEIASSSNSALCAVNERHASGPGRARSDVADCLVSAESMVFPDVCLVKFNGCEHLRACCVGPLIVCAEQGLQWLSAGASGGGQLARRSCTRHLRFGMENDKQRHFNTFGL
jgi:hypothetical protein